MHVQSTADFKGLSSLTLSSGAQDWFEHPRLGGGAFVGSARQVFPAAADQCSVCEADRTTVGDRARVLKSPPALTRFCHLTWAVALTTGAIV
ncbi:MAG: hypothetical protein RLZZ232_561 [Planctomycetota bacterium]|jgi:hypothetical protein